MGAQAYSDVVVTSKTLLAKEKAARLGDDLLSSGCQTTLAIGVKMNGVDWGIVVMP